MVVAGRHAASVFQAAKHNLDAALAFVPALGVFDGHRTEFQPGAEGLDAFFLRKRPTEPFGVIFPVCQHPRRLGQLVEQSQSTGLIANLASGGEEAQGAGQIGPSPLIVGEERSELKPLTFKVPDQQSV